MGAKNEDYTVSNHAGIPGKAPSMILGSISVVVGWLGGKVLDHLLRAWLDNPAAVLLSVCAPLLMAGGFTCISRALRRLERASSQLSYPEVSHLEPGELQPTLQEYSDRLSSRGVRITVERAAPTATRLVVLGFILNGAALGLVIVTCPTVFG